MFTNRRMLREAVVRLAMDRDLRMQLGDNLKEYLDKVVAWNIVAEQYAEAYELARQGAKKKKKIVLPMEF
ncbi:MAG: hypothetical protein GWP05_07425 [Anaerolineaceae bacterium]|nr:hypothetical protein [Anaerolineaceae bacterium]